MLSPIKLANKACFAVCPVSQDFIAQSRPCQSLHSKQVMIILELLDSQFVSSL